jgi:hypothetical protein
MLLDPVRVEKHQSRTNGVRTLAAWEGGRGEGAGEEEG